MTDPYSVLGISPDSSEEEIKSTYRKLVKQYHPDANPKEEHAVEKMNQINAAYAMLRDGERGLFLDDDWFREQQDDVPRRRSILYHPMFRRIVVTGIAVSLAAVGIVSSFFSALRA